MSVGQTDFTAAMLDPARAVPEGLLDPQGRPAGKRFDVYRNNVAVSLTEALETGFPVIRKLVGEANFKLLAGVFLREHPPSSPLMMHYGAAMPGFLEGFEPVASLAYLPDVARLELALRESYHAADATPLDPAEIQALPGDRLMASRFQLAPALRLVRSRWPVHSIWRFNMEPGAPKPEMRGENVLITRPEFDPGMTTMPAGGGTFVARLMEGATLSEALAATQALVPDFDPTATLAALVQGAAITAVSQEPRP